MANNSYDEITLQKEIMYSQGYGELTKNAQNELIKLCKKTMENKTGQYRCYDDQEDAYMSGVYYVLKAYDKIKLDYGGRELRKASSYFIQVFKIGIAHSFTNELKYNNKTISLEKIISDQI